LANNNPLYQENLLINHSTNDNQKFSSTPAVELIPVTSLTEKECLQKKWPKNKPTASIGFPHLLYTQQGIIPTFWAMLPQKEIDQFINKKHHTEFISQSQAYPMVLWIIMLSNEESLLTRWLSNYLDMKNEIGQKMVKYLEKIGYYHLLFFTLENPNNQPKVMTLTLTATQRQDLSDCMNLRHLENINISSQEAKNLLKIDYEKFKLKITNDLNKDRNKISSYVKSLVGKVFNNFLKKSSATNSHDSK
jgi:serine/threonine-protein kinase